MAICGDASSWAKVCLVCIILALAFHIAGFATINWMSYSTSQQVLSYHVGLWKMTSCNSGECKTITLPESFVSGILQGVRAMETLTFIGLIIMTVLSVSYIVFERIRIRRFALVLFVGCIITGITSFIGIILFFTYFPEPYVVSYSLGLTVIGMLLVLIAGTLTVPEFTDPREQLFHSRNSEII